MANFTHLPNEIVLDILDLCRPDGFESLALTCKHHYILAQELLEGHQHCKYVSRVRLHELGRFDLDLLAIGWLAAHPPRMALLHLRYIKTVRIVHDEFDPLWYSNTGFEGVLPTILDRINNASPQLRRALDNAAQSLWTTLALKAPEPHGLQNMVRNLAPREQQRLDGLDWPTFLDLLFLYLTINVTTLHIDVKYLIRNYGYLDKIISTPTISPGFLSRLECIHVTGRQDSANGAVIRAVRPLLKLPHLQVIKIQGWSPIEWLRPWTEYSGVELAQLRKWSNRSSH